MLIASYLLAQARASLFGALADPFLRAIVMAFALLMGGYALKAYWQSGMVPKAEIEAATQVAQTDALATRAVIEQQRSASEQADSVALAKHADEMEQTRNAWKTASDSAVVFRGDDGWLREKSGNRGR